MTPAAAWRASEWVLVQLFAAVILAGAWHPFSGGRPISSTPPGADNHPRHLWCSVYLVAVLGSILLSVVLNQGQ